MGYYQPQLVFSPDFWTIQRYVAHVTEDVPKSLWWAKHSSHLIKANKLSFSSLVKCIRCLVINAVSSNIIQDIHWTFCSGNFWHFYPPPRKLTWQWKIHQLKMYFLLEIVIFHLAISVFRTYFRLLVCWSWVRANAIFEIIVLFQNLLANTNLRLQILARWYRWWIRNPRPTTFVEWWFLPVVNNGIFTTNLNRW